MSSGILLGKTCGHVSLCALGDQSHVFGVSAISPSYMCDPCCYFGLETKCQNVFIRGCVQGH